MPPKSGKKNTKKTAKNKQQTHSDIDDILLEYQQKAAESKHVNRAAQQRQRRQPPNAPDGFEGRWNALSPTRATPEELQPAVLLEVSVMFLNKGNKEDALYLYDLLLYRSPQCASGWYGKGEVLSKHAEHEGAIRCFRTAMKFDPTLFCSAEVCIVEYAALGDYDGLLKRGEEYLELARQVSSESMRARCVRKVLGAVLDCLTDASQFSRTSEEYFSQLAQIVKEHPSVNALYTLAKYMRTTASAKSVAYFGGTTVDIQTENADGCDRTRTKQAIMFFQEADAISFEDYLKDTWLERCFVGPHFGVGYGSDEPASWFAASADDIFQWFKRKLRGDLAILLSMLGEEVVAAEDLLADGDFMGAAMNCFFNGHHGAALELVDEHEGNMTPCSKSIMLYHIGVRSIFKPGWHLKQSDLTDQEVSALRSKLFKYCTASKEMESEVYATLAAKRSLPSRRHLDMGAAGYMFASIVSIHRRALWGIFAEAVETGDVETAEEYFWRCWEFLKSRGSDTSERLQFLRIVGEMLQLAFASLDAVTDLLKSIQTLQTELQQELDELEEQQIAPQPDDCSPAALEFVAELLKEERRLCVAIRREEATDRDEMEETTRRALKKAAWKEQVDQRRRSSPQGREATTIGSADAAAPPCRTTAEQRETMCRLLEHPASDAAATVAVVDDEVLPQRSVLFPRAVASDAVLTFTHALRPLHLHVHEVAAQLFNLSEDGHSPTHLQPPEERCVTVLRRGKAAPQTIVEVLSSVIAACERGFSMRSSGLKSFSLPMTGVPDGVWRRGGGNEIPITEVVPSKGASLRVWGIQTAREVRLRFVAKDGFHKPIGDSYRFVDCVGNPAAFLDDG